MTVGTTTTDRGGTQGPITTWPFNCEAVTPADATVFAVPTAIEVWGAGDLVVTPWGGQADITRTITAAMLPYRLGFMVRVVKTATTATLILGVW